MKCHECGSNYKTIQTNFRIKSKIVGNVIVPKVELEECKKCGDQLLDNAASLKVAEYIKAKEAEAIGRQPISEFIDAQKVTEILGISKQALSKNPRIQRGFILTRKLGNYNFYLKESVLKYKESGDGRILLESGSGKYAIESGTIIPKKSNVIDFNSRCNSISITAGSGSLKTPAEELLEN